ncbi:MAG TPA: crosslink repair DNA glycosylase YcaQ family protein, partial [Anaerolineales bacterium]
FDYGGGLFIYPMSELPYWRVPMGQIASGGRWASFAASHPELVEEVLGELRRRGPLGNRDFNSRARVNSYRGGKDSALALYALWITGELMIHHRRGFERVYDFYDNIAPAEFQRAANPQEAEAFFARKAAAWQGLVTERVWRNGLSHFLERRLSSEEARRLLESLVHAGELAPLRVESSKETWYLPGGDLPLLAQLQAGGIPQAWQPLEGTTRREAVFLAPLEIVSARGRAGWLFDFEYLWEVYKPADKRRWGYYTLPVLYGDRLVARLDPKLVRSTSTLVLNGFWLEDSISGEEPEFAAALGRGLGRLARFVHARRLDTAAIQPDALREQVRAAIVRTGAGDLET